MSNNVELFRESLLGHFPTLKLPKGKKYVEFPVYKGILVCCMVKKEGVNVYLYSGGKVSAKEIFDKLNSFGVTGKILNDKYTINPIPGSRNPNVVRIDLLIPYEGRDLENDDLRKEVLDVYTQLIDLCMPLNPDNPFYDSLTKGVENKSEKFEIVEKKSSQFKQDTSNTKKSLSVKLNNFGIKSEQKIKSSTISIRLEGFGQRNELYDISKSSINQENQNNSDYWYDDFSENHADSDCDGVISYSLPFYNDKLKVFIEGDNVNEEIDNNTLKTILHLDRLFTKTNEDQYETGVGSERTPFILFQFKTKGIYHFESFQLPAGEEFDLKRLSVNRLKPIAPFEDLGINNETKMRDIQYEFMVQGFIYTLSDGTKKQLDFESGDYSETPLNPKFETWFDVSEKYDDFLTEEERILKFFKQFEYRGNEIAEEITEQNNGKIDDFVKNIRCPGGLLEALYDEFIGSWVEDMDNDEIYSCLKEIKKNPNASKILLTKVFRYMENNQLEGDDWIAMYYRELASDVCDHLGDKDWSMKLYKKVEDLAENSSDYRSLAESISDDKSLGDKDWSIKLYIKAEELAEDSSDYRNLAESISDDKSLGDMDWVIKLYKIAEKISKESDDYRILAESISNDKSLGDMDWARDLFKKVETMGSYLYDFMVLAGSVSDKNGLNDQKWSEELFQKGLIIFRSNDYEEHPSVKEFDIENELKLLSGDISNYSWESPYTNLKKWQDTIDLISDKLENGLSRKDAVADYLDDEYKENLNSENSDKHEIEIDNVNEVKYINYDEVNWVNPPGWEQDAPYVDGKPFTGIVYENYPNGQRSLEDQYTDGIRHGKQTKFYENGYVHWEKIYEYNKFIKWSVKINDTKHNKPEHETVSKAPSKNETEKASNSIVMSELDFDEDLENYYYPKGTKILFSGIAVEYYSNGQKSLQEEIVDGKNHGKCTSWYENGQLKHEGNFIKGSVVGITKRWYPSGQLEREENWIQDDNDITGQKLLSRTMYNEDGSIKSKTDNKD